MGKKKKECRDGCSQEQFLVFFPFLGGKKERKTGSVGSSLSPRLVGRTSPALFLPVIFSLFFPFLLSLLFPSSDHTTSFRRMEKSSILESFPEGNETSEEIESTTKHFFFSASLPVMALPSFSSSLLFLFHSSSLHHFLTFCPSFLFLLSHLPISPKHRQGRKEGRNEGKQENRRAGLKTPSVLARSTSPPSFAFPPNHHFCEGFRGSWSAIHGGETNGRPWFSILSRGPLSHPTDFIIIHPIHSLSPPR